MGKHFDFETLAKAMEKHIDEMMERYGELFVVDMNHIDLAEVYLNAIPVSENPIFNVRRYYDCSCCKSFIRKLGPIVAITDDLEIVTIFDFKIGGFFDDVLSELSKTVKQCAINGYGITGFFATTKSNRNYGCRSNAAVIQGRAVNFNHLHYSFDCNTTRNVWSDVANMRKQTAEMYTNCIVLERALATVDPEALDTVLDICKDGALYRGDQWIESIKSFKKAVDETAKLESDMKRHLWCLKYANNHEYLQCCRIMNQSIGVLIQDISDGEDLETAVKKYERIVAPENYKRPKAIYTKKMLQNAKEKLSEMGLLGSLKRRFATIDDISADDVLYINRDTMRTALAPVDDIFGELEKESVIDPRSFENVQSISFDSFMGDVVPSSTRIELYFSNNLMNSLMSIIGSEDENAPSLFNWDNSYAWAYTGNIADSSMKELVRAAGGNVDGDLRFSLQWNDIPGEHDGNDLDAHCVERYAGRREHDAEHIYYGHKHSDHTCGFLDIDVQHPAPGLPAVENIAYASRKAMRDGAYSFHVADYAFRGGRNGFRAEIEFDGNIYSYDYRKPVLTNEAVMVAQVTLREGKFTIEHALKPVNATTNSVDAWGVKTCTFLPVSIIMNSPNYWPSTGSGRGNKHIFFIIPGMVNDETPNGFYNEFIKSSLNEHRHVMEALGEKLKVVSAERQLSGIGCSVTKHQELVMRVDGKRVYKVKI